jgi:hypothetical protein
MPGKIKPEDSKPEDGKKGTGEPGWTPAEKGTDVAEASGDAGAAGEAEPKGRPTGDREKSETAAARTDRAAPPRERHEG